MMTTVRVWTAVLAAGGGSRWSQSDKSKAPESIKSRPCIKDLQAKTTSPSEHCTLLFNVKHYSVPQVCSASPGQLKQRVLPILLLGVGGLAVVFIKVGCHYGPANIWVLFASRYLADMWTLRFTHLSKTSKYIFLIWWFMINWLFVYDKTYNW